MQNSNAVANKEKKYFLLAWKAESHENFRLVAFQFFSQQEPEAKSDDL